jgi:hypothetical protein
MAKKTKSGGSAKADRISTSQNAKLGDIYTASKAAMADADYSEGYPANEGELRNKNFATRQSGGSR